MFEQLNLQGNSRGWMRPTVAHVKDGADCEDGKDVEAKKHLLRRACSSSPVVRKQTPLKLQAGHRKHHQKHLTQMKSSSFNRQMEKKQVSPNCDHSRLHSHLWSHAWFGLFSFCGRCAFLFHHTFSSFLFFFFLNRQGALNHTISCIRGTCFSKFPLMKRVS